ncbi:hypothetical protein D9M71_719870 [compost metagenome]
MAFAPLAVTFASMPMMRPPINATAPFASWPLAWIELWLIVTEVGASRDNAPWAPTPWVTTVLRLATTLASPRPVGVVP